MKVKVLEIDPRGKVRLSMRVVDQETGDELEDTRPPREPREPRGDRPGGDRGDRRGAATATVGGRRGGGGAIAARAVKAAATVTVVRVREREGGEGGGRRPRPSAGVPEERRLIPAASLSLNCPFAAGRSNGIKTEKAAGSNPGGLFLVRQAAPRRASLGGPVSPSHARVLKGSGGTSVPYNCSLQRWLAWLARNPTGGGKPMTNSSGTMPPATMLGRRARASRIGCARCRRLGARPRARTARCPEAMPPGSLRRAGWRPSAPDADRRGALGRHCGCRWRRSSPGAGASA